MVDSFQQARISAPAPRAPPHKKKNAEKAQKDLLQQATVVTDLEAVVEEKLGKLHEEEAVLAEKSEKLASCSKDKREAIEMEEMATAALKDLTNKMNAAREAAAKAEGEFKHATEVATAARTAADEFRAAKPSDSTVAQAISLAAESKSTAKRDEAIAARRHVQVCGERAAKAAQLKREEEAAAWLLRVEAAEKRSLADREALSSTKLELEAAGKAAKEASAAAEEKMRVKDEASRAAIVEASKHADTELSKAKSAAQEAEAVASMLVRVLAEAHAASSTSFATACLCNLRAQPAVVGALEASLRELLS